MARPNTFRENVKQNARKAASRALERSSVSDADLDAARDDYRADVYQEFFKDCRDDGQSTQRCGALWSLLKERGDVQTGGSTSSAPSASASASSPPASATTDGGSMEMGAGFASLDDLEETLSDADAVYLITQPGCPSCEMAKDALKDWIDSGLISVEDIQTSDLGADIVVELDITALPALVTENNGDRQAI